MIAHAGGNVEQQQFTFGDLKKILINRVGIPEQNIADDPNVTFDAMGLDSLALVELQLAIQQKYGFAIDDGDTRHITTIGGAIDFTNRRIREKESSDARSY